MTRLLLLFLVLGLAINLPAQTPPLMPLPASMTVSPGRYAIDASFHVTVKADPKDDILFSALNRTFRDLNRRSGAYFKQQTITTTDTRTDAAFQVSVSQRVEPAIGTDESYTLDITTKGILLVAPTTLGALHGLRTLEQLLSLDSAGYFFPIARIKDSPRFAWRGLMIDVARHFLPEDVLLRNIEAMAAVKLNVLHLHISDDEGFRVESKVFPLLHQKGSNGEYFTQTQIKEIIAFARERGIIVYPEFDLPGHSRSWFAGYPELASAPGPYSPGPRFNIDPEKDKNISIASIMSASTPTIDPTKEGTYAFLDKLFKEMAGLFNAPYFHIGADENNGVAWKNNPAIMAWMKEKKIADVQALQAYFVSRSYGIVKKYGKTMVGWEELFSPDIAKDVIVQKWITDGPLMKGHGSPAQIAAKGNRVLVSAGFYLDLFMPAYIHYLNETMPNDANSNYLGGEAAQWTEAVDRYNAELRIWPRAGAIAERLWSPASIKDVEDMYRRLFALNGLLDVQGLQHITQSESALRTLSAGQSYPTLAGLASLLTPVKGYKKLFSRFNKSAMAVLPSAPNLDLSDVLPVDAEDRIKFRNLVAKFLNDPAHAGEADIRARLMWWQELGKSYPTAFVGNARLMAVASHAADLEKASAIGVDALDRIKQNKSFSDVELKDIQAFLDKAKKNVAGEVELSIIPEIESLVKQKLVPEPKQYSLF